MSDETKKILLRLVPQLQAPSLARERLTELLAAQNIPGILRAAPLADALRRLQALTPLDAAILLASLTYPPGQVALALNTNFPALDAFDAGGILLHARVFPQLDSQLLKEYLMEGDYYKEEAEQASHALYPVRFTVRAQTGWQDSGYGLIRGHQAVISVESGSSGLHARASGLEFAPGGQTETPEQAEGPLEFRLDQTETHPVPVLIRPKLQTDPAPG